MPNEGAAERAAESDKEKRGGEDDDGEKEGDEDEPEATPAIDQRIVTVPFDFLGDLENPAGRHVRRRRGEQEAEEQPRRVARNRQAPTRFDNLSRLFFHK